MTTKTHARDTAALERLAAAARTAAPHRVARIIADLEAEQALAQADAAAFAAADNKPASLTATQIAASISRMSKVLEMGEADEDQPKKDARDEH